MLKNKRYEIEWRDHFSTDDWTDKKGIVAHLTDDEIVKTTGYYLGEDKHYFHFCQTMTDTLVKNTMSIMKNCVLSIKEL
jgi:hypothetical protein